MCQDCEGSQKMGERVYEGETQEIESGTRSFGKLLGSWVDGAKVGGNGGGCCGRILSLKSSLCIFRTRPETQKE